MPGGARLAAGHVARFAAAQRRLVGEQVGVGPDDRQRGPQLVGDQRDQLAAGLVDGLERLDPRLGLGLLAALLDDPGQQVGDGAELRDVLVAERPPLLGLDVEDADDLVVPGERHRQHRGDEPALVDAADPQEAGVGLDVGDDQRPALGGDDPGHALAERDARPADLVAVEAVRRGQRQVRSVAVEQIERGDIRVEHVAGPVDDGLEQLVPRPRGGREPGDLVQEAELLELVGGLLGGHGSSTRAGRAVWHGTRTGRSSSASPYKPTERLRSRRLRPGGRSEPERTRSVARVSPRKAAVTSARGRRGASRSGSGRPGLATRSRPRSACSAPCSARSSPSRPVPSCSRPSSGSGIARSPSDATTIRSSVPGSTRSSGRSISAPPRPSSPRSRSTSASSTSPRRAAASGRCAAASGPRATGSSTIRSRTRSPGCAGSGGRTRSSTRWSPGWPSGRS